MHRAHHISPRPERLEGRALLSTMMVESEPNNRARTADVVMLDATDGSAQVAGTASAGDRDFFFVPNSNAGAMTVALEGRGNARVALKIADAATGQPLFETSARSGTRSGSFNVAAGETLLVRVVGSGHSAQAYTFNLAQVPAQGRPADPPPPTNTDGSIATANPLSFDAGGRARFTGTLSDASDVDFYRFTAPRTGRLTIIASRSQVPVIVRAQDASGRILLTIYSDLRMLNSSLQVTAGATYYLQVAPQKTTPAPYEVSLILV